MIDPGIAYDPARWSDFFSAETGASAALTGLLLVAVSINLSKIISIPLLTARSAKALITLAGILVAATLCLVPGQSATILGWELVVAATPFWIAITITARASLRDNTYVRRPQKMLHILLAQGSGLPLIAAGFSLVLRRGGGLYWSVAGVIVSFLAALLDTWVLLIEIQR